MADTLVETNKGLVKILRFNKPHRKNALDSEMYLKLTKALNDAARNNNISMVVITGTGDFYSSGNDLKAESILTGKLLDILKDLIDAFIMFPKPLAAIVNGPAVGITVTTLALCDFVFAAENAYFYTPFGKLGVMPEGCSTYTFPKLMGFRKAMDMLVLNKKMSAQEAKECGLINDVWKFDVLQEQSWKKIDEVAKLSDHFTICKERFRKPILNQLLEANRAEMDSLRALSNKRITSQL